MFFLGYTYNWYHIDTYCFSQQVESLAMALPLGKLTILVGAGPSNTISTMSNFPCFDLFTRIAIGP